jgi:uncharacterized protein
MPTRKEPRGPDCPVRQRHRQRSASLLGFDDRGTFWIYVEEERIGTVEFKWWSDGSYAGKTVLSVGGQDVTTSIRIASDSKGAWRRIVVNSPAGTTRITRTKSTVNCASAGSTVSLKLKEEPAIYDAYSPALVGHTIQLYDRREGGKQTFAVFLTSGVSADITLRHEKAVRRTINGCSMQLDRFRYALPGLRATVWVDADGRVRLLNLPSQRSAFVRKGYELLRRKPRSNPLISAPVHCMRVEQNVGVPMRDGVKLATDIYHPEGPGKFPVILIRTPYKKELEELQARYYGRRGYVVAVQDVRGRFGSSGAWEPFVHEGKDGYDAIEWLAAQAWSTGKVGMIGGSYCALVQWRAAVERPPHLVTIIPVASPTDPFYNGPYEYGVFLLLGAIWWTQVVRTNATADISGLAISQTLPTEYPELLRSLPVIDLDRAVLGKKDRNWRRWLRYPPDDPYWQAVEFLDGLSDVRIPVFHQTGWFDWCSLGTKLNYAKMVSCGHQNQKLVIGPWNHFEEARVVNGRDFGPSAIFNLQRASVRWFDYWLKGMDNRILAEPLVSIFVMGSNRWLDDDIYPLRQTWFEKWYLAGSEKPKVSKEGFLVRANAPLDGAPSCFMYDPADPTPDPGIQTHVAANDYEKVFRKREDMLVYISRRFRRSYTFAGPVSLLLHASSSAKDTDWHVRLMVIERSGTVFLLCHGAMRARYRRSSRKPELLEPGKVYAYHLDLWQTAITIRAGSRLRLEVASAAFPTFSCNLNTGGHNEIESRSIPAMQRIYHSRKFPSYLVLPVIPS